MSDRDLRAELLAWIEAREKECEAATPGPWAIDLSHSVPCVRPCRSDGGMTGWLLAQVPERIGELTIYESIGGTPEANARLLASARTALPLALKALRGEVENHSMDAFGFCKGWPCSALDMRAAQCPTLRRLHTAILGESA